MTRYNTQRFTPGSTNNSRTIINRALLVQYYRTINNITDDNITEGLLCSCIPPQTKSFKNGLNNPSQTENTRISQSITGTLGGKITFGNFNKPANINYLGGWEGQPGGLPRPLRNKF